MRTTTLLTLSLFVSGLTAQSFYVPADTPGTGTANAFPFNTSDMRYQALVLASELGSTPAMIRGFSLAPSANGTLAYAQVTMKMAHLASPTLSTDFATNLAAGATTTMDQPNWVWPVTGNVWNQVDMQTPFFFNGVDNVVVEFTVIGRSSGVAMRRENTNQRVYLGSYVGQTTGTNGGLTAFKMRWITGDAELSVYGRGCPGSNSLPPTLGLSGSAQLGQLYWNDLTNALPNTAAALVLGFGSTTVDLSPAGLTSCNLYVNGGVTLFAAAGPNGDLSLPVGIPSDPAFTGIVIYSQYAALDTGAAGNATTSNYGRALIGN